jgi:hypothetical protein
LKRILALFSICLFLFSCEKEDPLYPPSVEGTLVAGIGKDYRYSVYFNIEQGSFVRSVEHDKWTLSFSSDDGDSLLSLNTGNFMFAKNSGDTNFSAVVDTLAGIPWRYDFPTGEKRRKALKPAFNSSKKASKLVFVLDLGFDADGNTMGYRKFQLLKVDLEGYTFRYAQLDGSDSKVVRLNREDNQRRIMYDMRSHQIEDIEPPTNSWDMCFTQYTDYDLTTEGDTLIYLVRGVQTDSKRHSVFLADDLFSYEDLQLSDVLNKSFSNAENTIGYDWKIYDFDVARYIVQPQMIYVVNTGLNGYYALRFVDYYNDLGERGYASFEIKGL